VIRNVMPNSSPSGLVLVGGAGGSNVGESFRQAAKQLGLPCRFCDAREASRAPRWLTSLFWRLAHRPVRLNRFGSEVLRLASGQRPAWLLSTGLAPLARDVLRRLGEAGVIRINFLTDDPWNPALRAGWFFKALPEYDVVYSPRRSNLADLAAAGCRRVEYLPFGFDPRLWFPVSLEEKELQNYACEVLFVGGADADRAPYVAALCAAGLRVAVYGAYWERYPDARPAARGYASPAELRKATCAAKVSLCLVRRANRDGHVMRSFEMPAMGACMLVEDTGEHRELFGPPDEAVVYFRTIGEMLEQARGLLADEPRRRRLGEAVYRRIVSGANTYRDRLAAVLGAGAGTKAPAENIKL
jgi:hypothetical protein